MFRAMLKSKIHRATVTEANIEYEGSITVDKRLLEAADILPYERVQVVDLSNGVRLETYAIEGATYSGAICVNGGAARLVHKGDRIIIISYAQVDDREASQMRPKIVHVDKENKVTRVADEIPLFQEC